MVNQILEVTKEDMRAFLNLPMDTKIEFDVIYKRRSFQDTREIDSIIVRCIKLRGGKK